MYTCSATNRGSWQSCISESAHQHRHKLSPHELVWGCHRSCSALSDLRYKFCCSCPSCSMDPSYHWLTKWRKVKRSSKVEKKDWRPVKGKYFICIKRMELIKNLLGHGSLLQKSVCTSFPSHCLPPCWGAGLAQTRVRCLVPPPHEKLQAPQLIHDDHFPSTRGHEQNL